MPVGDVGVVAVRSAGGSLSYLVLADRNHLWMMTFSWVASASNANSDATQAMITQFKAGLDRIGTFMDCDDADLTNVSRAADEMIAVNLLESGKSIIYPIGQGGALSKTLDRAGHGAEWHAFLYPSGEWQGTLRVTWIFGASPPFEAFELPMATVLSEPVTAASAPLWADRFAEALRTRDGAMMSELAEANGWRLAPRPKP